MKFEIKVYAVHGKTKATTVYYLLNGNTYTLDEITKILRDAGIDCLIKTNINIANGVDVLNKGLTKKVKINGNEAKTKRNPSYDI